MANDDGGIAAFPKLFSETSVDKKRSNSVCWCLVSSSDLEKKLGDVTHVFVNGLKRICTTHCILHLQHGYMPYWLRTFIYFQLFIYTYLSTYCVDYNSLCIAQRLGVQGYETNVEIGRGRFWIHFSRVTYRK